MECAISKLSCKFQTGEIAKTVVKKCCIFQWSQNTERYWQFFSVVFGHSAIILDFIATPVEVSQCHLRWSGCRQQFLKNVLALSTTLSSLHSYWVNNLVFRVLNWYFIRGRRLSYLFSVFVCKKKELLIPVFICFYCNYNCSSRG